MRTRFDIF